ncbi:MAG TPA: hypothetical protein VFN52_00105, partial [Acidiferrobacteraceae bacterium]|nr:hypothetical protein [Acidiferrobacteraceae bacterium]
FAFKKQFVQRRARRRLLSDTPAESFAELDAWLSGEIAGSPVAADRELAVARYAQECLAAPEQHAVAIERLTLWCIQALKTPEGRRSVRHWPSFRLPQPLEFSRLVPVVPGPTSVQVQGPPETRRSRDGFALTDPRMSLRAVQDQVHYCIYCHDHDGDFCSKGFPLRKADPAAGLKTNPLGSILTGCPLDEKISEMHLLKRDGHTLAALAMLLADNPMAPATGHRICNDCMKACIYQKQDPVDIPQIETRVLTDALHLPWGVEIYHLLVRWNPLRARQWLPRRYNGCKALVAGMGPAGFTLAHHLLMEGFAVVGIDGLKIEPLPPALVAGPVRTYAELEDNLGTRVMSGFGGVAEYGITVRWDKNFLKLIHLTLLRRPQFQVFGGVRLGGTLLLADAWELGFDHVAIALGTGLPRSLAFENSLSRGMRQAVDFLMALQLTGAAKASSLTNLQVRMPAVVVGGGLTGIDTATEVQAYYIAQVEKILSRYERLAQVLGEARIREQLDEESLGILNEYLDHGRLVRIERERAAASGAAPDFAHLLHQWGGVTVVYRRAMNESPAYLRNHEEIIKALEEGVFYADGLEPEAGLLDRFGHVEAMRFRRQIQDANGLWQAGDERVVLPARSVFVAAGATPNTVYEREYPGTFAMEANHFQPFQLEGSALVPVPVATHCKEPAFGPFTSYEDGTRRVSFVGDTHPVFHGTVVKAIASGMRAYPQIVASVGTRAAACGDPAEYQMFRARMAGLLQPEVVGVMRHSPTVIEIQVRAPMAARNFRPGQFFRLQNYERQARVVEGTRLQTEALALTGAGVATEEGLVSLMVLEVGTSSRLCATLAPGDPVVLMGPTGAPSEIPTNKTLLVIGGRRGAAAIRTFGPALRSAGNRVLYVAGFQTADEVYCQDDLEAAADVILWCTASGPAVLARRPQDRALSGDLIESLRQYAAGMLHEGDVPIPLTHVDRVVVIGSNRLIRMVRDARTGVLASWLQHNPELIASVGSPMQCMLKGVCSQCLQWHIDPSTGKRTRTFFACAGQDQCIHSLDLDILDARLGQNALQEKLSNLWLDYLFSHHDVARV